ncbi:carboxypeptidase-like regulatory domain-containing protein [Winogradskyella jejuensis]|uniref:Carboxypeptidase regulatory-like domain-containing protein n=1 Tax=Winogradskyella jejuensis TaxID=1089305 RepID=A0A1M5UQP1_9FLAO|nr:carboxypeptidase-like regulatory domain-containing protein [Winogradskyella jejuensis]SHH65372.1 hypothetical protein SAMN05444148_2569 [Winogradskyella jejuensis]
MRLKQLALLLLLLFLNCADTQVDNNVRVLVTGTVLDQNDIPIYNANVKIVTDANSNGALPVLLAEGLGDVSGNFEIISLFGSNNLFYIEISADGYSTYTYRTNTSEFRPEDLIFNLGDITLKKLSKFNYTITRESSLGTTLDFSLSYITPTCIQVFDEGVLNTNESFCFEENFIARTLNDNFPDIANRSFFVGLGDIVKFTYGVNGGVEQEDILTINSEDYVFEFTY